MEQELKDIKSNLKLLGIDAKDLPGNQLQLTLPEKIDMDLAKRILSEDLFNTLFNTESKPVIRYFSSKRLVKKVA